jgi:hypothetical protein
MTLQPTSPDDYSVAVKRSGAKVNLNDMDEDPEDDQSEGERSDAGSQQPDEDYDVDEEYDNDYAENYFDNGEVEDFDDVGGGAGGGEDGGGRCIVLLASDPPHQTLAYRCRGLRLSWCVKHSILLFCIATGRM